MIWHPLPIAVFLSDTVGVLMILSALPAAMAILAGWQPQAAQSDQINLEQRAESASLQARFGLSVLVFSCGLMVAGIATVMPDLIPGAMCGTGVLQAMGGRGERAIGFHLISLVILFSWLCIDRLNSRDPQAPLSVTSARVLLLAVPFLLLGWKDTLSAFFKLKTTGPVDCCASVYNRFLPAAGAPSMPGLPDEAWLWILGLFTLALAASAAVCGRTGGGRCSRGAGWVATLSLAWVIVAAFTLVRVLSAYHYEVLHHHCPWCLFLPDYHFIGFLLFGALLLVVLEGAVALTAGFISRRFPSVQKPAEHRLAKACRRILFAVFTFAAAAGLPAAIWRLRFGVWLG